MPKAVTPSVFRTGFHESVPRTGMPSSSSRRNVFIVSGSSRREVAQRFEHDGVDLRVAVDALLEVRDTGPRLERVVAELHHPRADLVTESSFQRQPVLARRHAEQPIVELVEPSELFDGPLVVVDTEVDGDIGELSIAAVSPGDEERRRLLAAAVAAGGLRRPEAFEQPGGEAP